MRWGRENETKGHLTRPLLLLTSVTELLATDITQVLCDLGGVLYPLWASVFMTCHPVNEGLKDTCSQFLKSKVCYTIQDQYSRESQLWPPYPPLSSVLCTSGLSDQEEKVLVVMGKGPRYKLLFPIFCM